MPAFQDGPCALEISQARDEIDEAEERSEDSDLIVVLFEEGAGPLVERFRTSKIALPSSEFCKPEERPRSLERLQMLRLVQGAGDPGAPSV